MAKQKPIIALKYKGPGHFQGIPARDLTTNDLANLKPEQIDLCIKSGLYIPNKKQEDKS